jgi:dCMP deaminase
MRKTIDWTQWPKRLCEKVTEWTDCGKRVEVQRSGWDETMLAIAHDVRKRSIDSQTQCGCVITDRSHKILGVGYNGFPRDIDDSILPNVRPDKYDFMLHSELNAILNCEHRPENGIAYVTSRPCVHCTMCLWQVGIRELVYEVDGASSPVMHDDEQEVLCDILFMLMEDLVVRTIQRTDND